jgi:hypothetical protein
MTEQHFEQTVGELLHRKPFRIFTIELHGGRRFEIDGPDMTAIRSGVAVFLSPAGAPIYFDHDSVNTIYDVPVSDAPSSDTTKRE